MYYFVGFFMNPLQSFNPIENTPLGQNASQAQTAVTKETKSRSSIAETAINSVIASKANKKLINVHIKAPLNPQNTASNLDPAQAQQMVKTLTGTPDFSYIAPHVQIPENLKKELSPEKLKDLKEACLSDYRTAMRAMEDSVADVAGSHLDSMKFADKLNSRLFSFIETYAEVLLEEEGRISADSNPDIKKAQIDLKVNELLVSIFSDKKQVGDRGTVEQGNKSEAGNIGMNPLAIRRAFKDGNLREKMYLPYKTTIWASTYAIFSNPEKIDKINQKLQESGKDWQVNTEMLKQVKEEKSLPFHYSPYAGETKPGSLRTALDPAETQKMVEEKSLPVNASEGQRRLPLSDREKRHATGELTPESTQLGDTLKNSYESRAQEQVQWKPGSYWYKTSTNAEQLTPHDYLTASEAVGARGVAGISGSVDLILTISMYFGMTNFKELEQGRLACLGWMMLDAVDHSVNEIMTSSKGFGFDYTPSPTSYRQIYSQDPGFIGKLETAQESRNTLLPDNCLSQDYVLKKKLATDEHR